MNKRSEFSEQSNRYYMFAPKENIHISSNGNPIRTNSRITITHAHKYIKHKPAKHKPTLQTINYSLDWLRLPSSAFCASPRGKIEKKRNKITQSHAEFDRKKCARTSQ